MNQKNNKDIFQGGKGLFKVTPRARIKTREDLSTYYTPGVAELSKTIAADTCKIWELSGRSNLVAVVSDGTAVLGLGDIGPEAAYPVMAGKSLLFKEFADIDAVPVCLDTKEASVIIQTVKALSPSFGGVNLEDISAPRCFEIEDALQDLGIPVMHDDQHGTAVVVLAGLINAMKITGKKLEECTIAMSGAGAAGTAIAKIIDIYSGNKVNIIICDSKGIIHKDRKDLNTHKRLLAKYNRKNLTGDLAQAVNGADIFIGVSKANLLDADMIKSMAEDAIVFAMANPVPEIDPELALKSGAKIVATGRSDYPNQINNVLAFPGIFRGALDAKALRITPEMKMAAALALAGLVKHPTPNCIIPSPLDKKVAKAVSAAVKKAALAQNNTRPICS